MKGRIMRDRNIWIGTVDAEMQDDIKRMSSKKLFSRLAEQDRPKAAAIVAELKRLRTAIAEQITKMQASGALEGDVFMLPELHDPLARRWFQGSADFVGAMTMTEMPTLSRLFLYPVPVHIEHHVETRPEWVESLRYKEWTIQYDLSEMYRKYPEIDPQEQIKAAMADHAARTASPASSH